MYSLSVKWIFGEYIRRRMDKLGFSLGDLADKSGISKGNLGYYVNGEREDKAGPPNPTIMSLISLAKALRVPPENLLQAFQGKDPDAETTSTPHPASTEALATRVIEDLDQMSRHVQQLLQAQGIAPQAPTGPHTKA